MKIGEVLSGAGIVSNRMRLAEDAERVARDRQLAIEERNRLEKFRREQASLGVPIAPGAAFGSFSPVDVEQVEAPAPRARLGREATTSEVLFPGETTGTGANARAGVTPPAAAPTASVDTGYEALYSRLRDAPRDLRRNFVERSEDVASVADLTSVYALAISKRDERTANMVKDALVRKGVPPRWFVDVRNKMGVARSTLRGVAEAEQQDLAAGDERRRLFELRTGRSVGTATGSELITPGVATGATTPTERPTSGPRGIRNHNPGNLRPSGDDWVGMVGVDKAKDKSGAGYLVFDTPENGIRAMARQLMTYQSRGLVTPRQMITTYAPANENKTEAYIRNVSKALGVNPDTPVDMQNPQVAQALVTAMIKQENSAVPYSAEMIQQAIQNAYTGSRPNTARAGVSVAETAEPGAPASTPTAAAPAAARAATPGYVPDINAVTQDMRVAQQQRGELVRLAQMYQRSGMGNEFAQVRQQILSLDNDAMRLQGELALQELAVAGSPQRLTAVWSHYSGMPVSVQPRSDGTYNVLVNGQSYRQGLTEDQVTVMARSSFDKAYRDALQQASASANAQVFETGLKTQSEIAVARATQEAQMVREIIIEQAKGNTQMGLEMLKQRGYTVTPLGDGTVMLTPKDGSQPFTYNPAGRTVEVDGVKVNVMSAAPVAGLPTYTRGGQ
jgi:hypothetical protein